MRSQIDKTSNSHKPYSLKVEFSNILMDYPIHNTDTMKRIDPFCISKGKTSKVLHYDVFLSP